jgi:hypothetical protein
MNSGKFKVFVKNLIATVSLLALANLPANAELLIGISFPSQGGGDDDAVQIDESLLTLPKLHLQDTPCLGPENGIWSSDPTIKFGTTYTRFRAYYPHQDPTLTFTNLVIRSYSYSLGPAKFDQVGFSTGLTVREQVLPQPLARSVNGKVPIDSSATSDSSISGSVCAGPATGILTATFNQNTLKLDWPADHIGWILQIQTNPAINSQWFPVPGSSVTNHLDVTLDRANTSVFFRLAAP